MTLQVIDPRYPVGKFEAPATITPDDRSTRLRRWRSCRSSCAMQWMGWIRRS